MYRSRVILITAILVILAPLASAVKIKNIEVSPDPVDYNKKFTITAVLIGDATGVTAQFYVDDQNYVGKIGKMDEKEIEGEWSSDSWDRYNVKCGIHTARVELYLSGQLMDNQSIDLQIGNVPIADYDPTRPQAGRDVMITLTDKDSKAPIGSLDVDFSHPQENTLSKTTDQAGKILFHPDNIGKYTLKINERDYCGEIAMYVKKDMIVDGPRPEKPVIGEKITVAFPANSDIGMKLYNSSGQVYMIVRGNTINGAANFTVDKPGNYILTLDSSRYWGVNKTFTVYDRDVPMVSPAPEKPTTGQPMTLTVTSNNQPLPDAHVVVTRPDGVAKEFTSTSDGRVNYGDNTASGVYEVRVEKERFATSIDSFVVLNGFTVTVEPEKPTVRDIVKFIVKDQNNKLVGDAIVRVMDSTMRKLTDPEGKAEFHLNESRQYNVEVAKDSYWNTTLSVTPSGILNLVLSASDTEIGGNITATVTTYQGDSIASDIKVTNPENVSTLTTASEHTFTADLPGTYIVDVFKSNYLSNKTTLTARPHPIDFSSAMADGMLYVNVTSRGRHVADLNVSASMLDWSAGNVTDIRGVALLIPKGEGNVTITANSGGDRYYLTKTRTERIVRSYRVMLLISLLSGIVAISLILIAMIQMWKRWTGQTEAGRGSTSHKRPRKPISGGSSRILDRVRGSRLGEA